MTLWRCSRGRLRVALLWEPRDVWVGVYWTIKDVWPGRKHLHLFVCLLPALAVHILLLEP